VNRRAFLTSLGASLLAAPLADAQPAGKVHHIGFLGSGSATGDPRTREAFREGLRELGWVEGQNLVIEYRFAEGRSDRLRDLAAELVGLKVDHRAGDAANGAPHGPRSSGMSRDGRSRAPTS
jgi:putative ABC transport system substrate-binding protein